MRISGQGGYGADGRPGSPGSRFQRTAAFRARWKVGDELLARAVRREGALTWVEADGLPLLTELPPGTPLSTPLRFVVAEVEPEIVLRYLGGAPAGGRLARNAIQDFVAARAAFEAEAGPLLHGLDATDPAGRRAQLARALATDPAQAKRHARVLAAAAACTAAAPGLRLDYPIWLLPGARTLERLHRPAAPGGLSETSLFCELEPTGALLAVLLARPGRAALRLKVERGADRAAPDLRPLAETLTAGLSLGLEPPGPSPSIDDAEHPPAPATENAPTPPAELLGVEPLARAERGGLLPRLLQA